MQAMALEWRPPLPAISCNTEMSYVTVEVNEKGAFGLPSTSVSLLSCLCEIASCKLD